VPFSPNFNLKTKYGQNEVTKVNALNANTMLFVAPYKQQDYKISKGNKILPLNGVSSIPSMESLDE
jgi:hypothetical protein